MPKMFRSLRSTLTAGGCFLAGLALTACGGGGDPLAEEPSEREEGSGIVVGSANFPESETVANIYAAALQANGIEASVNANIGSREVYLEALADGSIDLVPDYTGNLLLHFESDTKAASGEEIAAELPDALAAEELVAFEPAPANDKDAMVVTAETAEKWDLETIGDLAAHNSELTLGAPAEFQERPQGLPGLKATYGVEPAGFEPLNDGGGQPTVDALKNGTVDVADIFTTSPAIDDNGFVVLEDPKTNFPENNIVPVMREDAATEEIEEALNAVSEKLTTEEVVALNKSVSGEKKVEPKDAADNWLSEQGLDEPVS